MSRQYHGHKEPVKNIGLMVKNTVHSSISKRVLGPNGLVYVHLLSLPKHAIENTAKSAFKLINDGFENKLRTKIYDSADIWFHLADLGVNPVDLLYPRTYRKFQCHMGGIPLVPTLFSQTDGDPGRPAFDLEQARKNGARCDQLVRRVLELPTIICASETAAPLKDPRARLFALFLTTENPLAICAYSTELTACFDAWVSELSGLDEEYKMCALVQIFRMLNALSGSTRSVHACPEAFLEAGKAVVDRVFEKICEVKVPAGMTDPYDDCSLNAYGSLFTYLGIPSQDRPEYCKKVASTGNDALTISIMDGLIRAPRLYVHTCQMIGLSGDAAVAYLGDNLSRAAWYNPKGYADIANATKLTDAYRDEFLAAGYPNPVGTQAFDFLAQNLESGEHFEQLDYIRREDHGRPGQFAKRIGEGFEGSDDLAVLKRKVDLAIKLNQRGMLRNELECYFKKNNNKSKNRDLGKEESLKYLLLTRFFDPGEILHNPLRRDKALSMGLSGRDLLPNDGGSLKIKAMALEYDLGL